MNDILKVEGLIKKYETKVVLDNISFTIQAGQIVGLVGPNGIGKSTLMKSLVDLVKCDKGQVSICGYDVKKEREKAMENVSFMIESPSLYHSFTVDQFLKMNAYLRNVDDQHLQEAYDYLDFGQDLKKKIKNLSLGMKQEVALATSFMNHSNLYILDEPINGLDFHNVLKFRKKIEKLKEEGKSVLISSHILKELEVSVDYYIFLNKGKIMIVNNDEDIEKIYQEVFYEE